ncbi:hypothetical protein GCM10023169_30090 [Georgenia halophila]|uniref:Uncharacterized protein n=2 Tax=Georgenia halophila TaxID=620889 RepID=A0ABP8LFG2_9MICO
MPASVTVQVVPGERGSHLRLERGGARFALDRPVQVGLLDGPGYEAAYDSVQESGDAVVGTARVQMAEGTEVVLEDHITVRNDAAVEIVRHARVVAVGASEGVRLGLAGKTDVDGARDEAWQYFIPGTMYNRNDSDGDGIEDYLGTYVQEHRDDKNGCLAALARDSRSGATVSIARISLPAFDTGITPEQRLAREFVQRTDIGSLGVAPAAEQVDLRAAYPFVEEVSFCLDTDGSGWGAYLPSEVGASVDVTYELRLSWTPDLTEAIWQLHRHQYNRLGTRRPSPDLTLADSVEHRQLLTQLYYRKWEKEEDPLEPAGYLVHFSPRTGETLGSLIEFGFSGDQSLLAYTQLAWGYRKDVPLYRDRARSVLDFFVSAFQLENGFSHGIYDPFRNRFTHWFTGILMPFQYAENEDDVRRYVGDQISRALMPIARELREIEGNYLRTMCESVYPLLLSYELDMQRGRENDTWLEAGRRFGDFLLRAQAEDGSWYRAYAPDGTGLTSPEAWFGASYVEQKSGTIFPVPVLTALHRITGEGRYLRAAERAADFILQTFVEPTVYIGGLNDTTHVKSVKTDSVGVMFLMRSLRAAYDVTGHQRFLDGAVKAAKILASWVYLWDVPLPEGTLLAQAGFRSTGWAACDVIPSGGYLDNEFLEFTGDLVAIAAHARHEQLFDVAEIVEYGMQYALSTPRNDHGYVAPGIQCEGVMTAYWLSRPDKTEFSGAVAKSKGDDNDTCNALTNGQASYAIYELEDAYGTAEFDQIRAKLFG